MTIIYVTSAWKELRPCAFSAVVVEKYSNLLCVQKSRGLGMNGFSAVQLWMCHLLRVSILCNTQGVIFNSKVLMHNIQLPQRLFCNFLFCFVLLCFCIFAVQMIYDFLDHKGHIVGEIGFFSRNIIPSKGIECCCNYLAALKILRLQRHVDSRNLSLWDSVWHIYWLGRAY